MEESERSEMARRSDTKRSPTQSRSTGVVSQVTRRALGIGSSEGPPRPKTQGETEVEEWERGEKESEAASRRRKARLRQFGVREGNEDSSRRPRGGYSK